MDVFKLLARSTNLSKSVSKTGTTPVKDLPSAGQVANPQLFKDEHVQETTGSNDRDKIRDKKRKRNQDQSSRTTDLPPELDFFGNKQTNRDIVAPPQAQHQHDGDDPLKDEESDSMTSDENEEGSKRILNAHKLKITLLDSSEQRALTMGQKSGRKAKRAEATKKQKKHASRLYPQPLTSFALLRSRHRISKRLAENINHQGHKLPTEVQIGSLPLLLQSGRGEAVSKQVSSQASSVDLLTVAPTGSGKTLAYLIPTLDGLLRQKHADQTSNQPFHTVQALVVAPTKELAAQIVNEGRKLASGTGIKITGMQKGMRLPGSHEAPKLDDESQIVRSDILVTTPLVLLNALKDDTKSTMPLPNVKKLVLDEADVLLEPLFRDQTLGVWNACTNPNLRVSLWSATMGSNIESLAQFTIVERRSALSIPQASPWSLIRLVVGLKDSAVPNISHRLIYTATEPGKLLALRQLLHPTSSGTALRPPFLVFTQTIPRALALHSELLYDIPAQAGGSARIAVLHASLSDAARADVMARFRTGAIWVLITTDLLARGVDFRGLNGVVNYDVPGSAAAYVHRVGRTGRAGRTGGVAVTFYTQDDIACVRDVASVIAASERVRRQSGDIQAEAGVGGSHGLDENPEIGSVQPWLLAALPKPSKKERKALKRRGVAARRTEQTASSVGQKQGDGAKGGGSRMRISTKSGFDRKMQNRRRGAVRSSRARKNEMKVEEGRMGEELGEQDVEENFERF